VGHCSITLVVIPPSFPNQSLLGITLTLFSHSPVSRGFRGVLILLCVSFWKNSKISLDPIPSPSLCFTLASLLNRRNPHSPDIPFTPSFVPQLTYSLLSHSTSTPPARIRRTPLLYLRLKEAGRYGVSRDHQVPNVTCTPSSPHSLVSP